ncbi:hypothetical protein ACO0TG_26565, partial [Klebsiella pneumoniae]|nr:hypothetical protein MTE2_5260 [Klebsiella pneumoniae VA360]EYB80520.1 hypothetical protein KPB1_5229 [Klebsiella pneumoniae Kb140]BCY34784.1 hypothetical protein TUM12126_50780 [Klebsiella pneumoniae]BCY40014.1 hypothetical protein TUM12127_51570 [Klebsiella pneumoniae]BCY45164.1 hypothetical protein TUM12128_50740 [Klebsiella pneumoniae]
MKLETIQIDNTVRSGLNSFTDGVIIRDRGLTLSGTKTHVKGFWS